MNRYECQTCRYLYDPTVGDETSGVLPGTAFTDLPAEWDCPNCGSAKSGFALMGPAGNGMEDEEGF
ncbi:MAG: rubredoxin [Pseudomonadota bacterium]